MSTNHNVVALNHAFHPIHEFRNEFDRLFDDWLAPLGLRATHSRGARFHSDFVPTYDMSEDDHHFEITLEMAGVKKSDIKMELRDNSIFISGERRSESRNKEAYSEIRYGKFQKSFTLPSNVNLDQVQAHYENGILKINLPKAEGSKPRQIKISDGISASPKIERTAS